MNKKTFIITFFNLVLFLLLVSSSYSQFQQPGFVCDMTASSLPPHPFGMGYAKPMKTLPTTNSGSFFRVLMVFVEFDNETGSSSHWTAGQLPDYADELFAPEKEFGLNAYEDYLVSNYFNKISNDQFDVIGDVYRVELSHEYSYYSSIQQAETEVFSILDNVMNIDWTLYDQWSWNETNQEYEKTQDDYIDMAYIQYRKVAPFGYNWGGYGANMVNYTTSDGKHITNLGIDYLGTGVTGLNGANMNILDVTGLFRHEYCHYTLVGHRPYSTIGGGDGTNDALGCELGFSPQDLITVGLANVSTYNGSIYSYDLDDMTTTGNVLKIPSTNSGEFFLVSNRQRIAGNGTYTWDCNMAGDTAMSVPFKQFRDYSKGLYIYHVAGGDNFEAYADLECADGLWNWNLAGYNTTPDWNNYQQLPVFVKSGVGYDDDDPYDAVFDYTRMSSRDGHSVVDYTYSTGTGYHNKWFSKGQRHIDLGDQGIDRIYSNLEEDWCSRETGGDRWDAWKNGYNEVFSPYSSPNTKDRSGNQTGIFVYFANMTSGVATVHVYQADADTEDEEDVLAATPPSRPMLYKIEAVECNNDYALPKITWANNKEPDMVRSGNFKRYNIFRAYGDNGTLPVSYSYLETYNDYTPDDTASYIDRHGVGIACGLYNTNDGNVRYKVRAVDENSDSSVFSDFISTSSLLTNPDNPPQNTEEAFSFSLEQNYPNPFNPTTEIRYSIPNNINVTLKIYNALGQIVAELVNNEYKTSGKHSVVFEGSNLASGIYFYSLEAGTFKDVKKMVLLK